MGRACRGIVTSNAPEGASKPSASQARTGKFVGTVMIVAEKVALKASVAAKSNEKLVIPTFTRPDAIVNWRMHLGLVVVVAGGYSDEAEVAWLSDCNSKYLLELASLPLADNDQADRWRELAHALCHMCAWDQQAQWCKSMYRRGAQNP